jgi:ABC-type ATPase involved in cell division
MKVSDREGAPLEAGSAPFEIRPGGFLLVVSGPSGAGKGSLVERSQRQRGRCGQVNRTVCSTSS